MFSLLRRLPLRITIGAFVAVLFLSIFLLYRHYARSLPRTEGGRVVIEGVARAGDPNFDEYVRNVQINNVKGELWTNFKMDRMAVISGMLSNYGDRRLEAIELKITLFDVYGRNLREHISTPFRPGVPGVKGPLESLQSHPFSTRIEGIPDFWDPRRVDVQINGLKFAEGNP